MLRIIAIVAVIVAVAVAALLAWAATRPDTFAVQRAASIGAPPETIYPLLADFRRYREWSPYEKKDPAMKRTFTGAESGKGAVYAWEGDSNAGTGRMEIVDASPPSKVVIDLAFVEPFETRNVVEFTLQPEGATTRVTWAMRGPSPYVAKVMGLFFSMDGMIGKDFEAGLADLKAAAEK